MRGTSSIRTWAVRKLVLAVIWVALLPFGSAFLIAPPATGTPSSHSMLGARRGALLLPYAWRSQSRGLIPPLQAMARTRTLLQAAAVSSTSKAPRKPRATSGTGRKKKAADAEEVESQKLIIVESATKAKTIRKYLPDGWDVDFCMGHVRELPRSMSDIPAGQREKFRVLGVRVDQEFEPVWVVLPGKEQVVNRLKVKAKTCSELYLATDEDREGEAISWHLLELLKPSVPTRRVVFHEITPSAVQAGLDAPRDIDLNLVNAQQARRILDRVAGYTMSPLLWKKITTRLSAGRVQSAGLKLLVDRERERMLFVSASYAGLRANVRGVSWMGDLEARLQAINGRKIAVGPDFDPRTGELAEKRVGTGVMWVKEEEMEQYKALLEAPGTQWIVKNVESKMVTRKRPAPFTTSTMQQESNSRLGLTSAQTMKVAQALYEEGFISYMRTDSPNMGREAVAVAQQQALDLYGSLDAQSGVEKKNSASASAQEAHEAIRPSIVNDRFVHPRDTGITDKKKLDLYQMIYERALASVMKDAKLERKVVALTATAGDVSADFQLSGQTVVVHGFLRALRDPAPTPQGDGTGGEEGEAPLDLIQEGLQNLKPGQSLSCTSMKTLVKTTAPPYRFTQGSFVRMVEELGIGRPSTYSTIIEVLKERGYFSMKGGNMVPTLVGIAVIQLLERHFPDFVDSHFTSKMEGTLDSIAKGNVGKGRYLEDYYENLTRAIDLVTDTIDRNFAKRVVLRTVGSAQCGIIIGPYGAYVRDLLPGEPTDAELLSNEEAARVYYQEVWSGKESTFTELASKVRATQVPPEMCNDPSSVTGEALMSLLDMSVQGKSLGVDPQSGMELVIKTASRYGKFVEMRRPGDESAEAVVKKIQVPSNLDVANCTVDKALRLLSTFPKNLGTHPETGQEMVVNMAYFPALRMGNFSYGLLNQSIDVILDFNREDAIRLTKEGKATYYLGDYQGAAMWFVPKGRYTYAHIRWNQIRLYVKESDLEANGLPSTETALAHVTSRGKGKKSGGSKARAQAKKAAAPEADAEEEKKKKRPPSAWSLHAAEKRPELAQAGLKLAAQQKQLALTWRDLSEADKAVYHERAEALKAAMKPKATAKDSETKGAAAKGGEKRKRKGTAYMFFCSERRPDLPPGMTAPAQMKELAIKWRGLSDVEKAEVEERFRAATAAAEASAAAK